MVVALDTEQDTRLDFAYVVAFVLRYFLVLEC